MNLQSHTVTMPTFASTRNRNVYFSSVKFKNNRRDNGVSNDLLAVQPDYSIIDVTSSRNKFQMIYS